MSATSTPIEAAFAEMQRRAIAGAAPASIAISVKPPGLMIAA